MNKEIINSNTLLFLGAGASAPLGLKPTGPFLELLSESLQPIIEKNEGISWDNESNLKNKLKKFFERAAQYHKQQIPDIELVLDYILYLESACKELNDVPDIALDLLKGDKDKSVHHRWAEMFSRLRQYIYTIVVRHYSQVDEIKASNLYVPLTMALCKSGDFLPVFTTNYDWVFEHLGEANSETLTISDGFVGDSFGVRWSSDGFENIQPSRNHVNVALFKLHGSTSWYEDPGNPAVIRKFPNPVTDLGGFSPKLIYPTQVKAGLVREEPFRTAYDYFEATLLTTNLAVVIGFSFRDPAVNEKLRTALSHNDDLKILVIDPAIDENNEEVLGTFLDQLGLDTTTYKQQLTIMRRRFDDESTAQEEILNTVKKLKQGYSDLVVSVDDSSGDS